MSLRRTIATATLLSLACRHPPSPPAPTPSVVPRARAVAGPVVTPVTPPPAVDASAHDAPTAPATDPAAPWVPDAAPMAPGCFAWSPERRVAACLVGQSGSNLNDDTVWRVAFSGEPAAAAISLVPSVDAGGFDEPHRVVTPPEVRARLRARLGADGFVDLAPLRRIVPASALEWAPGATVRWLHRRTFAGGDNAAERGTDRIELRWQPGGPSVTLTAWEDEPVAEPEIRAFAIPGGRYLVLDAVGPYADEGSYGVRALAWLCDREARTCR